jgi:hypothetical protein
MQKLIVVGSIAAMLCGCAALPENIAPNYVNAANYQNWTCQQLGNEEVRLNSNYLVMAQEQRSTRRSDAWGVVLVGLPIGSIAGGRVTKEVADLKGQLIAVHNMQKQKGCTAQPNAPTKTPD